MTAEERMRNDTMDMVWAAADESDAGILHNMI